MISKKRYTFIYEEAYCYYHGIIGCKGEEINQTGLKMYPLVHKKHQEKNKLVLFLLHPKLFLIHAY